MERVNRLFPGILLSVLLLYGLCVLSKKPLRRIQHPNVSIEPNCRDSFGDLGALGTARLAEVLAPAFWPPLPIPLCTGWQA